MRSRYKFDDELIDLVEDTISLLGLNKVENSIVGGKRGSGRGISGGQLKRVNIGVELVADPKLILLDEPTSGLDSASSEKIMKALDLMTVSRSLTVVVTLHQPRRSIFERFDEMILLSDQGELSVFSETTACLETVLSMDHACVCWLLNLDSRKPLSAEHGFLFRTYDTNTGYMPGHAAMPARTLSSFTSKCLQWTTPRTF